MKKLVYLALAALLLAVVGYRISAVRAKNTAPAAKVDEAPLLRAAAVQRASVPETLALTGTIRPRNEVDVYAKVYDVPPYIGDPFFSVDSFRTRLEGQ